MRRLSLCAGIALAASSCAIPTQDNPNDPKNRPIPAVIVQTQVAGEETPDPGDDVYANVSSARRGTRFRFDASGTAGPKGEALTFRWDFDDDPTTFEFPPATNSSNSAMVAVVVPKIYPADLALGDGVGIALRTVRLHVEAGAAEAELAIQIAISNEAPLIDPGENLVVPAFSQHPVTLDPCGGRTTSCTTSDPDGDLARDFHWTQVGPPTVTLSTDGQGRATFVPPATPEHLVFRLQGSDGLATRHKDLVVQVGSRAWARTSTRLYQLDGEARARTFPSPTFSFDKLAVDASGDLWLAGGTGTGSIAIRRYQRDGIVQVGAWAITGNTLESLVPSGNSAIVGSEEGFSTLTGTNTVTVLLQNGEEARDSAPGGWLLTDTALYRDSGGISPDKIANIPGVGASPQFFPAFLALDIDGVPWVASQSRVFRLQGASLSQRYQGTSYVAGISAHPDGGIWEAHLVDDGLDEGLDLGIIPPAEQRRRVAVLPSQTTVVTLAPDPARRAIWILSSPRVFRVDAPFGESEPVITIDLETQIEAELGIGVDETLNVYSIAADVRHGLLAVSGVSSNPVNVDTGHVAVLPFDMRRAEQVPGAFPVDGTQTNPTRVSVDPTRGDAWFNDRNTGVTRMTSAGRRIAINLFEQEPGLVPFLLGPFPTSGGGALGAFGDTAVDTEAGVVAVSSTGATLSQSSITVRLDNSPRSAGNELGICGVANTSVILLDPVSGAPFRIDPVAGTVVQYSYPPFDRGSVDALAVSVDGSTCWIAIRSPNHRVLTVSGASTVVESGVLAAQAVALAADPRTGGGVWRADVNGTIARFAGGAGSFVAANTPVTALAVERLCDVAADPACIRIWYAAPGVVVLSRPDGTVIERFPVQGEVTELAVPR